MEKIKNTIYEFALLFRMNITSKDAQPTKQEQKVYMKQWMEWITAISDDGHLAEGGNHFSPHGRVLRADNKITEGPYEVNMESVAGYIIILAKDMDDATKIASQCPILNGKNTSVEIRQLASP